MRWEPSTWPNFTSCDRGLQASVPPNDTGDRNKLTLYLLCGKYQMVSQVHIFRWALRNILLIPHMCREFSSTFVFGQSERSTQRNAFISKYESFYRRLIYYSSYTNRSLLLLENTIKYSFYLFCWVEEQISLEERQIYTLMATLVIPDIL